MTVPDPQQHYAIRGGPQGRERLRLLARIMQATSASLLDRVGLCDGLVCLDAGCGGGDVTLELARRVAPHGRAVGIDLDEAKLEIARGEARQQGIDNVTFVPGDLRQLPGAGEFDVVYARFLLTHLREPETAVRAFHQHLHPGGAVAVEDIDFRGAFTYPESAAHRRFQDLYCATVRRRGGDPDIGPRLPSLLREGRFERIGMAVAQPIGTEGEVKLMDAVTMENIADAAVEDGLATREETEEIARELYAFARDVTTVAGLPRIVQTWGWRS